MDNKNYKVHHLNLAQAKRLLERMDSAFNGRAKLYEFLNELYEKGYEVCFTVEEKDVRKHTEN